MASYFLFYCRKLISFLYDFARFRIVCLCLLSVLHFFGIIKLNVSSVFSPVT